jgi:rhamnosyltransferase subunit B
MHMAHDQPDNADRVERLGAGLGLSVRRFTPERVADTLNRLHDEKSFHEASMKCASLIAESGDMNTLMRWIEARMILLPANA